MTLVMASRRILGKPTKSKTKSKTSQRKVPKAMATHATAPALAPGTPEIPNKLYFRIGDVSRIAGVKPYVLRYWETEFPAIGPKKSGSNHRLYRRKDVELILDIKRLLYQERYTIEGARKHLDAIHKAESMARTAGLKSNKSSKFEIASAAESTVVASGSQGRDRLGEIRAELRSLLDLLSRDPLLA